MYQVHQVYQVYKVYQMYQMYQVYLVGFGMVGPDLGGFELVRPQALM